MRGFLSWLMGEGADAFGPDTELGIRLNQAPEGWLVFLLVIGVVGFTWWVYSGDGRGTASRAFRFFLGTLRVILIAMILLILTEPVLLATKTEIKPSTVLVLVDDSFSMKLGFPYAEEKLRAQVQAALGKGKVVTIVQEDGTSEKVAVDKLETRHYGKISRMQVVCSALRLGTPNFFDALQKKGHQVKLYTFSKNLTTTGPEGQPLKLTLEKDLEPQGQETRIGDCLRQAMKDLRGSLLAGVVLITDGRQNAGEDAVQVAASQFKTQRVPIFSVSVGDPSEPKDIEITVTGPDTILPEDPSEVVAYVRQVGGYDALGEITLELKGENGVITTAKVKLGPAGEKVPVTLKFKESKPGKFTYTVSTPVQDGELREENNKANYSFQVIDKKVKILMVEGPDQPRWEYRYLRNALMRDHTAEADVLLSSNDGSFIWDGTRGKAPLETFPVNKKEINDYDVVIFGDVNPDMLTSDQQKLLRDYIREGGGFIMIAGERFAPSAYNREPLNEILPIVPARGAYEAPPEGFNEFFPVERTAEGKKAAWTFLDQDEHNNDDIWENLPKLRWYYPVKRALASATVIATHPTDKSEEKDSQGASKKMPLIVVGPYGSGKSLFIGTDELWRWRFGVGDRYHYRFYNQAIRFVARKLGGQKRFRLDADKASYAIGDKVVISGVVRDANFNSLTDETVTVYMKTPKGESQTVELHRLKDREGYEGQFFPNVKGDWAMWLKDKDQPEERQGELNFRVDVPQLEMENPRMNEELLMAIAANGGEGGKYYTVDQLEKIPPQINKKEEKIPREIPMNLWDKWPVLALFTLLITAEWLLRKRGRMI